MVVVPVVPVAGVDVPPPVPVVVPVGAEQEGHPGFGLLAIFATLPISDPTGR